MRSLRILGFVLIAVGLVVAVLSGGAPCYGQVIPGLPPSGPSCTETVSIAAVGLLVCVFGFALALRGRRSGTRPSE